MPFRAAAQEKAPIPVSKSLETLIMALMETLKLPLDQRGKERAAAQAEWIVARSKPLESLEIFAD